MELQNVPVAKCFESLTNPRGTKFEGKEFDELVASVKEKGVLMPILVRPQGAKFEVVAGNRRFRAAKLSGLTTVPASVVEMSDNEAREAQIVENLQRADVHPLEEGEAYRQLIEQSGYDLSAVGAKVGKTEGYVRDRLVLTNLIPAAKKMFREADMHAGHAALVARLDEKQQKDAVTYLKDETDYDKTVTTATTKDLRDWIHDRVLADSMKNPPWNDDEQMKELLGGCEECSGKGGDLFGKRIADACTNPKCYATRLLAFISIKREAAPSLVPVSGSYSSQTLPGRGNYEVLETKKDTCEFEEQAIIIEGEGLGHVLRICRSGECEKHWPNKKPSGGYKQTAEERAANKKKRAAEKAKKEKDDAKIVEALAKLSWPLKEKHLDILFETMFERFGYIYQQPIAARHKIQALKKTQNGYTQRDISTPLRKHFEAKGRDGKVQYIFEICAQSQHETTARAKLLKEL